MRSLKSRSLTGFLFFALLITLSPIDAKEIDTAALVDIAGRQRMLTQRAVKSYLQIDLGANPEKAKIQLGKAIELFEMQHTELQQINGSKELKLTLGKITPLWGQFVGLLKDKSATQKVKSILELDEQLLEQCEVVVYLLQATARRPYVRVVNISGRQRMLSQRMAKIYMLLASGFNTPTFEAQLDRTMNEFKGGLDNLIASPDSGSAIQDLLDKVLEQWTWLESSLNFRQQKHYPIIVADASGKILELMERVTQLYAEAAGKT